MYTTGGNSFLPCKTSQDKEDKNRLQGRTQIPQHLSSSVRHWESVTGDMNRMWLSMARGFSAEEIKFGVLQGQGVLL